jgi:hypothetical protein
MNKPMAYSGNCSNSDCIAVYVVAPHDESPDDAAESIANGPESWDDSFPDCFVCGQSIDWNGNDYLPLTVR